MKRRPDSGLTLVEVLVSLSVFALIGLAGFALIEAILNSRDRTEGRLERLGEIQRAMHLLRLDLEQANGEGLVFDGAVLTFSRTAPGTESLGLGLLVEGGRLQRHVRLQSGETIQTVLTGVSGARWRFFRAGAGWLDAWPPPGRDPPRFPDAIALDLALQTQPGRPGGTLRRVIRVGGAVPE